jgi:hypothetical protein
LGGLTSAIYNEVLKFFLIVAGFLQLVYLGDGMVLRRTWIRRTCIPGRA